MFFETPVSHLPYLDFIFRLVSAIFCGFLIGLERQWINRVAGIQTNVLVCTGSCIFILGSYFVSYEGQSASRIAAQIVSGIGFLGAGMIFRDGMNTHGINTAATIWCAAAVGVLCGMGLIPQALTVVGLLVLANYCFRKVDHTISKKRKWNDTRIVRHYNIEVIVPKNSSNRALRKQIFDLVGIEDHKIYAVKTNILKNDYIKIIISFNTRKVEQKIIQDLSDQISALNEDFIVEWSQTK